MTTAHRRSAISTTGFRSARRIMPRSRHRVAGRLRSGDGGGQGAAASSAGAPALQARLVAHRGRRDQLAPLLRHQRPGRRCGSRTKRCSKRRTRRCFGLYQEGLIDGVRVDHVDGLADPPGYCRRLRARLDELAAQRPANAPSGPAWLVVEKILGAGERLPDDWEVDGTSGYDFMDDVNALLHDAAGEAPLRGLWGSVSGRPSRFRCRGERRHGATCWTAASPPSSTRRRRRCIASRDRGCETRDVTFAAIRRALVALLAHFPVYRSYGVGRRSRRRCRVRQAVAGAMADVPCRRPSDRSRCWIAGCGEAGDDREHAHDRASSS